MSSEDNGDSGPGTREVARRLFAAEFDDAEFSYSESDEERAPNYVVAPTGERVNRLFAVGVLTEVAQAGDSILRARVADPTGAFVVYAGQYQPEAMAFLDRTDPPAFVALTGKARTFQPDDADVVYTSVRPEEMNVVDRETRDRWVVTTAKRTLERVGVAGVAIDSGLEGEQLRSALVDAGVDESLAAGVPLALERYGTTPAYLDALQELALDAARLVAGDIDEVGSLALSPAEGDGTFTPAVDPGIDLPVAAAATADATGGTAEPEPDASFEPVEEAGPAPDTTADTGTAGEEPTEPVVHEASAAADEQADTEPADAGDGGSAEPEFDEPELDEPEDVDVEFDPDEEVLDDEQRQAVEEEYGLEFESGAEVDSPDDPGGEPEPESESEPEFEPVETETSEEPQFEPTGEAAEQPDSEPEPEPDEEAAEPADDRPVGDVLIQHMERLDDGSGAPREELVAAVTEATGADEAAVDEAIEDALMSGRCYEPDDDRYASI